MRPPRGAPVRTGMLESHAMEMFMTLTLFSVVACLFSTSFGLLDTWF